MQTVASEYSHPHVCPPYSRKQLEGRKQEIWMTTSGLEQTGRHLRSWYHGVHHDRHHLHRRPWASQHPSGVQVPADSGLRATQSQDPGASVGFGPGLCLWASFRVYFSVCLVGHRPGFSRPSFQGSQMAATCAEHRSEADQNLRRMPKVQKDSSTQDQYTFDSVSRFSHDRRSWSGVCCSSSHECLQHSYWLVFHRFLGISQTASLQYDTVR